MVRISSVLQLLFGPLFMVLSCTAHPYVLVPQGSGSMSKRAFDRLDDSEFHFGMRKRAFDRLDGSDFLFEKRKRAFDRLDMADFGFRRKRAFDRVELADFGMKRKRAFDRLDGNDFGMYKRSAPPAGPSDSSLVAELLSSIRSLRQAREKEAVLTNLLNNDVVVVDE